MALNEILLVDFDQEMANTRKTLERVPVEKPHWKPHERSMPLGRLANHVADLPSWASFTIEKDSLDIAPPGAPPYQPPPPPASRQELLEKFDKNVAAARKALTAAKDQDIGQPWSLLQAGKPMFTMPRAAVIRGFVLNHMIHHRAILCVYYRLNNIPVPGMYGPSGDE